MEHPGPAGQTRELIELLIVGLEDDINIVRGASGDPGDLEEPAMAKSGSHPPPLFLIWYFIPPVSELKCRYRPQWKSFNFGGSSRMNKRTYSPLGSRRSSDMMCYENIVNVGSERSNSVY